MGVSPGNTWYRSLTLGDLDSAGLDVGELINGSFKSLSGKGDGERDGGGEEGVEVVSGRRGEAELRS